ncbi:signal peptidase II [Synechococcus sp. BSF8S]|uniref:signal peptidase II n=1 Tax=Synechococcales TaxID=1890424 RepID=UPI00162A423D|nr:MULTISPECIES: signal peptidase II [unclassified Synechococcus]MBC1261514.1 signal peptidase II [Synechococcus sp. BSF8S]MBC1264291.1 signal peptidase II [Synechococcus sp. BSA11S]
MSRAVSSARRHAWSVAALVLVLDQLTKAWASAVLPSGLAEPLLPGLLRLRLVFNTGAAFSLFTGAAVWLGVVSLAVGLLLVVWIQRHPEMPRWQWLGLGSLLGGAVGNGIDRWRLGGVVDFLEFVPVQFPVFNVADVAINVAVVCLILDLWEGRPRERR